MGWRKIRLGDVFENRKQRGESGLPTLSVTINSGVMDRDQIDRKTDSALTPEEHLLVEPGDIAYNTMRMWQGASGLIGTRAIVSPAYVVLKPTGEIDGRFASYLFKTQRMIHLFWAYSHGLTDDRRRLYYDDFSAIPALLPPLAEQHRIAEILSAWDLAIQSAERIASDAQRQKRALAAALLGGRVRLSGFSNAWRTGDIGELCALRGGSAFKERYQGNAHGELPFIKVSDMSLPRNRVEIREANNWVSRQLAAEMRSTIFPAGAIVFAKVGAALLLNKRRILTRETIIDNNMMAALPADGVSTKFLYQVLLTVDFGKISQDGALPSINQAEVAAIPILIPASRNEQDAIADFLSLADLDVERHIRSVELLVREKAGLLQQLLTGKRRVSSEKEAA